MTIINKKELAFYEKSEQCLDFLFHFLFQCPLIFWPLCSFLFISWVLEWHQMYFNIEQFQAHICKMMFKYHDKNSNLQVWSHYNCDHWAPKLKGNNLKVVCAEFSTLSWAVFVMSVIAWHTHASPHLELKTLSRFCPVTLSLSML